MTRDAELLISAAVDGTASAREVELLGELVRSDSVARRRVDLCASLVRGMAELPTLEPPVDFVSLAEARVLDQVGRFDRWHRWWPWVVLCAGCASAALVVFVLSFEWSRTVPVGSRAPVMVMSSVTGEAWLSGGAGRHRLAVGDVLHPGQRVETGSAGKLTLELEGAQTIHVSPGSRLGLVHVADVGSSVIVEYGFVGMSARGTPLTVRLRGTLDQLVIDDADIEVEHAGETEMTVRRGNATVIEGGRERVVSVGAVTRIGHRLPSRGSAAPDDAVVPAPRRRPEPALEAPTEPASPPKPEIQWDEPVDTEWQWD